MLDRIVEVFCEVDDFCEAFVPQWEGEHQKPWGSSGCGSEWGGLDIVGGHGRTQEGEQVMKRTVEGSCSRLQEPELPHGFWYSLFRSSSGSPPLTTA